MMARSDRSVLLLGLLLASVISPPSRAAAGDAAATATATATATVVATTTAATTAPAASPAPVEVSFDSSPTGAMVLVDGQRACAATPCTAMVIPGRRRVQMRRELHDEQMRVETIPPEGTFIAWSLTPRLGTLTIETEPPGLQLSLDGRFIGKSPITLQAAPGQHDLAVRERCWQPHQQLIEVHRDLSRTVKVVAQARWAGLALETRDPAGKLAPVTVESEGKVVGTAPGTLRLPLCTAEVTLTGNGLAGNARLTLHEYEVVSSNVTLARTAPPDGVRLVAGREWQSRVSGRAYGWPDARDLCEQLRLAGGHWQMPTPEELKSIAGPEGARLAPRVWGRSVEKDALRSWSVSLADGSALPVEGDRTSLPVLCVRPSIRDREEPMARVWHVPVRDAWTRGPADAPVTIVEYSDFQCPYCGKVNTTLDQLFARYPGKLRLAFKHVALAFHEDAPLASEAALAAGAQGRFWEMHGKIFAGQRAMERTDLDRYARELGLDLTAFARDLDTHRFTPVLERDTAEAKALDAMALPTFFVNGRKVRGAQSLETFVARVEEGLRDAAVAAAQGVRPADMYVHLVRDGLTEAPQPPPPVPPGGRVAKVDDLAGSPVNGAPTAKVTLVLFSEFQCPFCSRIEPTLRHLLARYGNDIRLVWKNYPLPNHPQAVPAALAALAAGEQGGFWEMRDLIFQHPKELGQEGYERWATRMKLDLEKFRRDMADPRRRARVDADLALAARVGVTATPIVFVNGREIRGAVPEAVFTKVIDEELVKATALLKAGTPPESLYAALLAQNLQGLTPAEKPRDAAPARVVIPAGASPARGASTAPVTLTLVTDLQDPFAGKALSAVEQLEQRFPGKVRLVLKQRPLPFHPDGRNAAQAVHAARVSGSAASLWRFITALSRQPGALSATEIEKAAAAAGLDLGKLRTALAAPATETAAETEARESGEAPVATTLYVNGLPVAWSAGEDALRELVQQELSKPVRGR